MRLALALTLCFVSSTALANVVTLDATTETLELETSSASSTDYAVSWMDNASGTLTPGSTTGNVASATDTTIVSPAFGARDTNGSTNGEGLKIALYALTALGNAAAVANTTVNYTNSAGTAARTATFAASVGMQAPATPVIGTFMPFTLQAGDTGVRSIQGITLTTTYTSGTMMLIVYRPITLDGVAAANFPSGSLVSRAQLNPGVRVYNDTCFALAVIGGVATTAPSFNSAVVELMER